MYWLSTIVHQAKISGVLFGVLAVMAGTTPAGALTSQQQDAIAASAQNDAALAETATVITFGQPESWQEALLAAGEANPDAIGMVAACMSTAYPALALDIANAVAANWPEQSAFVAAILTLVVPAAGQALTEQFGSYDGPDQAVLERIAIAAERRCGGIVTTDSEGEVPIVGYSQEFQDISSPN
jgi:hypothetical protein